VLGALLELDFEWRSPTIYRIEARPKRRRSSNSNIPDDSHNNSGAVGEEAVGTPPVQWDPNLVLKLNIYHTDDAAANETEKVKRLYVLDLQLAEGHVCEFLQLSLQVISLLKTNRR
jgi:hypothetical protein